MLPYTNGMIGFIKSCIGTGVPVKDKAEAYEEIFALLGDIVDNRSLKESRFSYPFADYAEKDMIEIYPLQLQLEDDPSVWTKYIMDLCSLAIQYDQSTILPLPLHLASALEEYLLKL